MLRELPTPGTSGRPVSIQPGGTPLTIRHLRVTKRLVAAAAAAALSATLLVLPSVPASATATVTATKRHAGIDRYATANALADDPATVTQDKFVLASGENFADGLTASGLAGAMGANLLLTKKDALPASTLATLTKMSGAQSPKYVVIVGGTNVISADIDAGLTAVGFTVSRVAGTNRYTTADAVAAKLKVQNSNTIGLLGGYKTAFLVNGTRFADAVVASGVAYKSKLPIFLTKSNELSAETAAAMKAAGVQQVIILGGAAAVSDDVKASVDAITGVITTTRIGGVGRFETATKFATYMGNITAAYKNSVLLVTGQDFPDALAASQLASDDTATVLPVQDPLPTVVCDWLSANQATVATIETVGGIQAIPASVVTAAKACATIAKPTASILALDGQAGALVTFSAQMIDGVGAGGAEVLTSYTRRNAVGVTETAANVAYTYNTVTKASKATVAFATSLAPGDVVTVLGFKITHITNGTTVATASATVSASTAPPSATITAYPGAAAATDKVWITFSANTDTVTFVDADLVHQPAVLAGAVATFNNCAKVNAALLTFNCDIDTNSVAAGDTVSIIKGGISSSAATPVVNPAAFVGTVTADITPPVLQSARYSISAVGGVQATLTPTAGVSAGSISVTARAATATAGKAGNLWSLQINDVAATSVTVNAVTKLVSLNIDLTTATGITATNALNGNAAFSALFIADVVNAASIANIDVAATALASGTDVVTTVATFSEPLGSAIAADFIFSDTVTGTALNVVDATNDGLLTGIITVNSQSNAIFVSGVSTLTTRVNVLDRNGVAAAAGATLIVPLIKS